MGKLKFIRLNTNLLASDKVLLQSPSWLLTGNPPLSASKGGIPGVHRHVWHEY